MSKLLYHRGGLDIDDVKALIIDPEVPQVDPQVVGRDERLVVAVDRYRVDVVGVRVGEHPLDPGVCAILVAPQQRHTNTPVVAGRRR